MREEEMKHFESEKKKLLDIFQSHQTNLYNFKIRTEAIITVLKKREQDEQHIIDMHEEAIAFIKEAMSCFDFIMKSFTDSKLSE